MQTVARRRGQTNVDGERNDDGKKMPAQGYHSGNMTSPSLIRESLNLLLP